MVIVANFAKAHSEVDTGLSSSTALSSSSFRNRCAAVTKDRNHLTEQALLSLLRVRYAVQTKPL